MNEEIGSLELTNEVVNAKYLLLRRNGNDTASDLYKITSKGPKVYSKEYFKKNNYPLYKKPKDYYLKIDIEKVEKNEFENSAINFKELDRYIEIQNSKMKTRSKVGFPFTVTLTELMNKKVK
jgi:hypothetical protein